MMPTTCHEVWMREVAVGHNVAYYCHFLTGHSGEHSWQDLKDADEAEKREPPNPYVVNLLLAGISEGYYDAHLEQLLAVGHERKRALRGVRTFPGVITMNPERQ